MAKVATYDAQRAQVSLSLAGRMLTATDTMTFPAPPRHAMTEPRTIGTGTVTIEPQGNRAARRKQRALARRAR